MMYGHDYEDALEMVQQSEFHNWWDDNLIQKYIEKPLGIRQYKIMRNDLHEPLVFATWGFPNENQVKSYIKDRYFPVDGYKGGGKDVWVIDFIAKKGYTRMGFLALRKAFARSGYAKAFWFRPEAKKLGWHTWKGI
jgi:hemolysin-activating ACP:hemolysin acyltransferase